MKVYLQGLLFSALLLCGYLFINIRLFEPDLLRIFRVSLFSRFKPAFKINTGIHLYNTGTLDAEDIIAKVNVLLEGRPRAIGVIACDRKTNHAVTKAFKDNPRVFVATCEGQAGLRSARIIQEGNSVMHFSGAVDSFENLLVGDRILEKRGTEIEMINFQPNAFQRFELKDVETAEDVNWKVLILGYLGDQLSRGDLHNFRESRITPLNQYYGEDMIAPDTYDAEVSAHIVATIQDEEFIIEIPLWARILVMLGVCLLNASLIMYIKTRFLLINVAIYILFFLVFILLASAAIVYFFSKNIYLNLDGLEVLLLIVSVFTVFSTQAKKASEVVNAG